MSDMHEEKKSVAWTCKQRFPQGVRCAVLPFRQGSDLKIHIESKKGKNRSPTRPELKERQPRQSASLLERSLGVLAEQLLRANHHQHTKEEQASLTAGLAGETTGGKTKQHNHR